MTDAREARREAFARQLTGILNHGALNLAMGMGYRARLFDAIHDQPRRLAVLKGVYALLKPGGAFSMVDGGTGLGRM